MRKLILLVVVFYNIGDLLAQDDYRPITTGVPFLMISSDARASGMGDMGVATSPNAFSQQWNPSKYAFAPNEMGFGISYTPYLREIVADISLLNATFYNRFNERSAFAFSLKYFGLGDIQFRDNFGEPGGQYKPSEFSLDGSYALKLSDYFSMAVTGRFVRSSLKLQNVDADASAASTFAVDVSGYYQSEEKVYNNYNGRWRAGFNISNLGPKIKYDADGQESFIPTNLKVGAGFDFIFDYDNVLTISSEFNKLLVPTPQDYNNDGNLDNEDRAIYNDIGFFEGTFKSFGDAPDGFKEELSEITWALGAEYVFREAFALRTGYFHESKDKGVRRFFTLGAGFKYNNATIDLSYLFSTSNVTNPLENTLRFGLTFDIGDSYYQD